MRPLLPYEVLGEGVGQHRARRRRVQHLRAAVFLAQAVVGRAVVDEQRLFALQRVGHLEKRFGRRIDDDEVRTGVDLLHHVLDQLGRIGFFDRLELELLVHEAAGGVVVGDRQLGAGNAEILRRQIEQRERQRLVAQLAREHDGNDNVVGIGSGGLCRVGLGGVGFRRCRHCRSGGVGRLASLAALRGPPELGRRRAQRHHRRKQAGQRRTTASD